MIELVLKNKIEHNLHQYYDEIKSFKNKNKFIQSAFYKSHKFEIENVINGLEWDNTLSINTPIKKNVRIVTWNIERGKQIDAIIEYFKNNEELFRADIILVIECDNGMGRTSNRNISKELAEALNLNYCFAPSYLVLGKGAIGETDHKTQNTTSLHGTAILSKYEIQSAKAVEVPPVKEVFHSSEKRLGTKKGLIAQINIGEKSLAIGAVHIDLSSTAKDRANQLEAVVKNLPKTDIQIVGGDWNCGTFNLRRKWEIITQSFGKLISIGFTKAIGHYMTPEKKYDRPLFNVLDNNGFDYNSYNDRLKGTIYFDINDMLTNDKTAKFIPGFLISYLQRKLKPWNGCVPLKIDWLAGKGAKCINAKTIEKPNFSGVQLSDHNPIFIDINVE